MKRIVPALFVALLLSACEKKDAASPVPNITFLELTPNTIKGGSPEDTTNLRLRFFDGDADLGGSASLNLTDSRDGKVYQYDFPQVDNELRDILSKDGLSGEALLQIEASAILVRPDSLHEMTGDTLTYEVFVKDAAGHESNRFRTSPLYIRR